MRNAILPARLAGGEGLGMLVTGRQRKACFLGQLFLTDITESPRRNRAFLRHPRPPTGPA
jgi:hypothetical protein